MYSLCIKVALLFVLSCKVYAAAGSVRFSSAVLSTDGSANLVSQNDKKESSVWTQKIEVTSSTIAQSWVLAASSTVAKNSDEKRKIKDSKGYEAELSKLNNQYSQQVGASVSYSKNADSASASFQQSVDSSDFKNAGYQLGYARAFNYSTTVLGIGFEQNQIKNPENYYYDNISARYLKRPESVRKDKFNLTLEQIWGDFYKTQTEFVYLRDNEERPRSAGITFRQLYSDDYLQSWRFDIGGVSEDRSQQLKNERGYLSAYWIELAYNLGLGYNLQLSPSYGYVVEQERNSKTEGILERDLQSVSDIFGLEVNYTGHSWLGRLKAELLEANTGFTSYQLQGVLQWEI